MRAALSTFLHPVVLKKNKFSMKFWLHTSGPWKGYFNHCTVLFQNRAMMFGLTQVNNSNIWAITNLTYMSYDQQLGIHSSILMKKLNHLIDDTIAVFRQALIPNSREDSLKSALKPDYSRNISRSVITPHACSQIQR